LFPTGGERTAQTQSVMDTYDAILKTAAETGVEERTPEWKTGTWASFDQLAPYFGELAPSQEARLASIIGPRPGVVAPGGIPTTRPSAPLARGEGAALGVRDVLSKAPQSLESTLAKGSHGVGNFLSVLFGGKATPDSVLESELANIWNPPAGGSTIKSQQEQTGDVMLQKYLQYLDEQERRNQPGGGLDWRGL
jgi:hypothetical protein